MNSKELCPCGSEKDFSACCAPILEGERKAETAEQLMRSRYSGYTLAKNDYLLNSWAPETRPSELDVEGDAILWLSLQIEECTKGGGKDTEGTVTFIVNFLSSGHLCWLHEKSRFVKYEELWYYLDGESKSGTAKIGRNTPCPCGSEKKFKKCCLKKISVES